MNVEVSTISESLGLVEVRNGDGSLLTVLEPSADIVEIVSSELMGPQGPAGVQGVAGVQGPVGPQGPFAPQFEQTFSSAQSVWVIQHNMNVFPVVTTYDLYGFEISGDVSMPDRNTVVVTFAVPFAGTARLKA